MVLLPLYLHFIFTVVDISLSLFLSLSHTDVQARLLLQPPMCPPVLRLNLPPW